MLTIFIPVYNEEAIIRENTKKLRKFLDKKRVQYKIVFGNNGSIDKTLKIIKQLHRNDPAIIKYVATDEKGIGIAFRLVLKKYRPDNVVFVDMDLSHDLNFILETKKFFSQGYDVIIGYKQKSQQERKWYRRLFSSINIAMCKYLLDLSYKDYGAGAKAYSYGFLKGKAEHIDDKTFFVNKLLFLAKNEKVKVKQIPVECNDTRISRFNLKSLPFYIALNILKLSIFRR